MEDEDKSREQLLEELAHLRQRLAALEVSEGRREPAEDALRESEERYRLLVESVKDYAIFMLDPEGRVTSWNEGARRIKGYEAEEIVGEHFSIFYPREDAERGRPEEVLRLAVEKGAYEEESPRVRKDGSRFWASVVITALRDEGGNLRGFVKVVRDVTERKRYEEALRRQAELLELSHEPIFAWELDDGVVYWNRGCEELYGFTREEALGRVSHRLLQTVFPVPLEQFKAQLERDGRWAGELEHTTREGRRVVVESRHALVQTSDGRRLVLETNRDVTGRRRAEEALRRVREAERRRISRDLHDVVLQDLSSALQALQLTRLRAVRSGPDLDLDEEIAALRRAAAGLRDTVYDLRSEEEQPFVRAVEALVGSERQRTPEQEVDLSVQEGFPQELPGTVGNELLRIVREALTNVRRHSGAGRVEVTLGADKGRVWVEVADDGRGFDPGDTSEFPEGGVGLRAMRERVEALGGEFEVRSRPGEGTRVTARVSSRAPGGDGTPGP